MSSVTTHAVALEHVTYRYPGTQAGVTDITLDIAPGELVVCLGPSGCGKTTLLRLIAGFIKPDAGAIRLNGEDVTRCIGSQTMAESARALADRRKARAGKIKLGSANLKSPSSRNESRLHPRPPRL